MRKMRNVVVVLVGFVVTLGLASIAQAGGVGLTLKGGTTGVGGDLTFKLNQNFNLRAGVSAYNTTQTINEADAELNLSNSPVLIDWHPWKDSGFRISTGVMFTDNYLKLSATNQTVSINDVDYLVKDMSGKINFSNSASPYFGIGWGNAVHQSSHWYFSTDIGVAFIGAPDATLKATADNSGQQAELDTDIAKQISTYKDDYKSYQFFPVITIGLSYAF